MPGEPNCRVGGNRALFARNVRNAIMRHGKDFGELAGTEPQWYEAFFTQNFSRVRADSARGLC